MNVSYTPELADEICQRLASGESLASICRDAHMPSVPTVYAWRRNETFLADYTRARDDQADTHADETIKIADESPEYIEDENGARRVDPGFVAWQRQRIDARKWSAGKMKPKKYGDKVDLNVSGELDLKNKSTGEIDARLAVLLGKAGVGASADGEAEPESPGKSDDVVR